jgi:hypothetical protein
MDFYFYSVKASVSWTHEAIMLLIGRRGELNHLFKSSTVTSRQAWLRVADDLKEKGHNFFWEKLQEEYGQYENRQLSI